MNEFQRKEQRKQREEIDAIMIKITHRKRKYKERKP